MLATAKNKYVSEYNKEDQITQVFGCYQGFIHPSDRKNIAGEKNEKEEQRSTNRN